LWRTALRGDRSVNNFADVSALSVDSNDDILAAGGFFPEGAVVKIAGASGQVIWHSIVEVLAEGNGDLVDISVDNNGDAVGVGIFSNYPISWDFTVVKIAGSTGEQLWRRAIRGSLTPYGENYALAVALDQRGDVAAAGYLANTDSREDFTVVKLWGQTGEDFVPTPLSLLKSLDESLKSLNLPHGLLASLNSKLDAAIRGLDEEDGGRKAAAGALTAFVQEVRAQRAKSIPVSTADSLVDDVSEIVVRLENK